MPRCHPHWSSDATRGQPSQQIRGARVPDIRSLVTAESPASPTWPNPAVWDATPGAIPRPRARWIRTIHQLAERRFDAYSFRSSSLRDRLLGMLTTVRRSVNPCRGRGRQPEFRPIVRRYPASAL